MLLVSQIVRLRHRVRACCRHPKLVGWHRLSVTGGADSAMIQRNDRLRSEGQQDLITFWCPSCQPG